MNQTIAMNENFGISEYSNIGMGALLFISEIMPFLKGKQGGIIEGCLCLLKGSSCFINKLTDTLEKQKENKKEVKEDIT